jgi:hypothetical protein
MYDTKDYLEHYKTLEDWADSKYDEGIYEIEKTHPSKKIQKEMEFFRKTRNLLTHNANGEDDKKLITLTDEFKERFEKLCNSLMNGISDIAIPFKDIYKRQLSDKVLPTINVMKERSYSYVPVMNGKKIWGVFGESTVFKLISGEDAHLIQENPEMLKIAKYITEYSSEGSFDFMGRSASIDDIRRKFSDAFADGRRLDVIYITSTGDKNGDLDSLVTIWDISSL